MRRVSSVTANFHRREPRVASAVRAAIGEEPKRRFEILQPVPQEMLALLVQVNALREDVRRADLIITLAAIAPIFDALVFK
jgi:hypothetical protein